MSSQEEELDSPRCIQGCPGVAATYRPSLAKAALLSVPGGWGAGLVLGCDIFFVVPVQRRGEAAAGGFPSSPAAGCEIGAALGLLCALHGPANSKLNGEAGLGSKSQIN